MVDMKGPKRRGAYHNDAGSETTRTQGHLPPACSAEPPSVHLPHVAHPYDAHHEIIHVSEEPEGLEADDAFRKSQFL